MEQKLKLAYSLLSENKIAEALKIAESLIDENQHDIIFLTKLGEFYFECKQYTKAIELFECVLKSQSFNEIYFPWDKLDLFNKQQIIFNKNELVPEEYRQEVELFESVLKSQSFNETFFPWFKLAASYGEEDNLSESQRYLNKAFANAGKWHTIGSYYYGLQRYEEALQSHEKAIEFLPYFGVLWASKGDAYRSLHRHQEALQSYDKAIELEPTLFFVWSKMFDARVELHQYHEVLQLIDKAIEIDPINSEYWQVKGYSCHQLQRYQEALLYYDKSLEFQATNSSIWGHKADILFIQKNFVQALACMLRWEYQPDYRNTFSSFLRNSLIILETINAPYFAKRLINDYEIENYLSFQTLINETSQDCYSADCFIKGLIENNVEKNNPLSFYRTLGMVNYFMGDAVTAFKIFDEKTDTLDNNDLPSQYYFVLSAIGFCEPHDGVLEFAVKAAEKYINLVDTAYNLRQLYYAGQIFLLNEEFEKALTCFDLSADYPPSEFMKVICFDKLHQFEKKEEIIIAILEKEKVNHVYRKSYIAPLKELFLDFNKHNFDDEIFEYAHYSEVREAVFEILEYADSKPEKWNFLDSYEQPEPIFRVLKINQEAELKLIALKNEMDKKVLNELDKLFSDVIDNFSDLKNKKGQDLIDSLVNKIEWKTINSALITNLIHYLYFTDRITYQDKFVLHIYALSKYNPDEGFQLNKEIFDSIIDNVLIKRISDAALIGIPYFISNEFGILQLIVATISVQLKQTIFAKVSKWVAKDTEAFSYEELKDNFIEITKEFYEKHQNDETIVQYLTEFDLINMKQ